MIDCRIRCFRSLLSILDIQILGLEMISSLQRVEFAVEIFMEFSVDTRDRASGKNGLGCGGKD